MTSSGRSQLETSEPSVHTTTSERPGCARVVVRATYTPSMTAVRPDGVIRRSSSRTAARSAGQCNPWRHGVAERRQRRAIDRREAVEQRLTRGDEIRLARAGRAARSCRAPAPRSAGRPRRQPARRAARRRCRAARNPRDETAHRLVPVGHEHIDADASVRDRNDGCWNESMTHGRSNGGRKTRGRVRASVNARMIQPGSRDVHATSEWRTKHSGDLNASPLFAESACYFMGAGQVPALSFTDTTSTSRSLRS